MTKTEKTLILSTGVMGGILLWLWLRKNPQAINYINQIAGDIGLPELISPAISASEPNTYNFDGQEYGPAQMPGIATLGDSNSCCPKCERQGMNVPPSPPVPFAQPTIREVEHLIYKTQYIEVQPVRPNYSFYGASL